MKIRTSWLCVQASVWVLASAFCVTSLTGCGATGNFTQGLGTDTAVTGLHGTVHGGPNPVIGATVTLYATSTVSSPAAGNNYGYGQPGTVLGSTTTDSNGNFTLTGDASSCTAGQQAYIVGAGGKTGANSANSAALLMAALGPCSGISNSTQVIINEPTTIAAAYALSGFMTVSGTTVNISAPAKNNAATATCTVVSNATTACQASGLAHAFLNAAELVNSSTGAANTTFSSGTLTATVPQQLIYTLANSVEACINSAGSSSTACTSLMTDTTPTAEVASPTAPTNTLEALLDLAQYPSMALGSGNAGAPLGASAGDANPSAATTDLFNLANSNAYYAPALTAAPDDFTVAVKYVLAPAGSAVAPWGQATDIQDNHYVYVATTPPTIYSVTSNGTQNWATATTATSDGCGSFGTRCEIATDTLGNVWVVDASGLTQLTTAGVLGTKYTTGDTIQSDFVDPGNNVWLSATGAGTQTGASVLEELPQGASTIVDVQVGGAPVTATTNLHGLAFDSAGNLWAASDTAGGSGLGAILMISSNNSLTSPAFAYTATANPAVILGGTGSHSWAPMVDGSGNAWVGSESELNEVVGTCGSPVCSETGGATNYDTAFTLVYGTGWEAGVERDSIMDGDGKIVVAAASTGAGYISVYYPNAPSDNDAGVGMGGADVYLNPCYVASATTTCATLAGGQSAVTNVDRNRASVDASGAIWVTLNTSANMLQILGPAAPSWSQVAWIPEALAPNLSGNATSLRPF